MALIANLRLQNESHPLNAAKLRDIDSNIHVGRQFLMAMKAFGISEVDIQNVQPFPIHFLMDFCRDNSNLKVLVLKRRTFNDEVNAADPSRESVATARNLDKLILDQISFTTSFAATYFTHFLGHTSVSALEPGALQNEGYYELAMPSVKQPTLYSTCEINLFQAALDAGMSTVI
jgi:COX Aromatic Rich Motif